MLEEKNIEINFYEPLIRKINSWLWYNNHKPTVDYKKSPEIWDDFRSKHDLDCILTGGNLKADTIISLWLPLRFTLVAINGYAKIKRLAGNIDKRYEFLEKLLKEDIMQELLPEDNPRVQKLIELFEIGQTRANVIILPERWMQKRGKAPYYDYMPYFLNECFEGGEFYKAFMSEDKLIEWLEEERLTMFFSDKLSADSVIDLSGSGDVKNGIPQEIDVLVTNYLIVLRKRAKCLDGMI